MIEQQDKETLAYEAAMATASDAYIKHPDAAAWAYDKIVLKAIQEFFPDASRELYKRLESQARSEEKVDRGNLRAMAAWAVSCVCSSKAAWMTPGFGEAYRYSRIHGS